MRVIRNIAAVGILALGTISATGCEKKTAPENDRARDTNAMTPRPDQVAPPTNDTNPSTSPRTENGVNTGRNTTAVNSITAARCDREIRCENVGNGKKYESRSECVTKVKSDWQDELSTLECPKGVVEQKLDDCLKEIRTESCGNPAEALSRMMACRQGEICKSS